MMLNSVEPFEPLHFTVSGGNASVHMETRYTNIPDIQYSIDGGQTWTQWNFTSVEWPTGRWNNSDVLHLSDGDVVYFVGTNPDGISKFNGSVLYSAIFHFDRDDGSGMISALGDVTSLIEPNGEIEELTPYAFASLFQGCRKLISAPTLRATNLSEHCYDSMFEGCNNLTVAPKLPATRMAAGCYAEMFKGCTSLVSIQEELPATKLASNCYNGMFNGCTSLAIAPSLPATDLTGCTSCYQDMFRGCTSITRGQELPATSLEQQCYMRMFMGCSSLEIPSELPAETLKIGCYYQMFGSCTSLSYAPILSAPLLVQDCYGAMFYNCTNLSYIACLATDISAASCTASWVYNVPSSGGSIVGTGTFLKAASMTNWTNGEDGIPYGWTVQNAQSQ